MATVIDIFEQLESNNSRLFKEELLDAQVNSTLLKRVFTTVGDVYLNFYVNKFRMPPASNFALDDDVAVDDFLNFITESLATRNVTGNAAKDAVISFFCKLSERQQKWCQRILLKNLRCGVQSTTVNKVWPNSIVEFSVQLAETLSTRYESGRGIVILDEVIYPIRVEPKLDGLRCILVKHAGEVTMFTRNGNVLETLPRIKSFVERSPRDEFILDGEIMGKTWHDSASVVMSHKKNKDDSNMIFHVFDAMTFDDWKNQKNSLCLDDRLTYAADIIKKIDSASVVQVPGRLVNDESELLTAYVTETDAGFEGIMLKDTGAPYLFKRSSNIRKLKPIRTYEGIIIGHYEGKRGSKREGLWGGFDVVLPNGITTRVAGGFTDKLKAEINLNPNAWLGKIIEVEGQPDPLTSDGLTADGRVRFPVFVRIRDSRDVDPLVLEANKIYDCRSRDEL